MNGSTGWRTLAEPTYATSRFGRTVEFPAGTVIRSLNPPTTEPFPGAIRVVAADGSPFEREMTTAVRPDGTSPPPVDVPALWWVAASALRFACPGCGHPEHATSECRRSGENGRRCGCEVSVARLRAEDWLCAHDVRKVDA